MNKLIVKETGMEIEMPYRAVKKNKIIFSVKTIENVRRLILKNIK